MNGEFDGWLLRVTDLKQWEYCPRVVYYQYCLPGVRPITYKMEVGIAAQRDAEANEERRSLRAYGFEEGERHFNVHLRSLHLGCVGQVDLVVERSANGRRLLTPVDYKYSRREPGRHFQLQLALYALMLEEEWGGQVEEGFIYLIPVREAVRVELSARLRRRAERALTKIRTAVQAERMPPPTSRRARCTSCEFRRFCNDVV